MILLLPIRVLAATADHVDPIRRIALSTAAQALPYAGETS
jgi:hypothetical protein